MTKRASLVGMLALAATLVLSACAQLTQTSAKIDDATNAVAAMRALAERTAVKGSGVRTARPRLAGERVVLKSNALPSVFDQPDSYVTKGAQSLVQILEDISATRGIAIRTSEIAQLVRGAGGQAGIGQGGAAQAAGIQGNSISGYVTLDYNGTTRGLLDEIATRADVTWRYDPAKKVVEFYRYETRTLSVYLPPGSKTISASISLSGVSGGGGGGGAPGAAGAQGGGGSGSASTAGNVSVSQNLTVDPWQSIMGGIKSVLTAGQSDSAAGNQQAASGMGSLSVNGVNGNAIANPEMGLVTVTAKPPAMERITRYVASINSKYAQNVLVDVRIFSVSLDRQTSLGFNLNMLYNTVDKFGGSIVGPAPIQPATGTPGVLTLASKNPTSPWDGSALVAQALSQFGKVSLQRQGQVLAVNGQPSPIQVANEISYIAGSSTAATANAGLITTQVPGLKVVGFTANFLPLILGDNRILLSYQMQISALAAPLTPNAQGISSPNVATQSFQQHAFVNDGEAIVLFGYDEQRDTMNDAKAVNGVSAASHNERQMIVIVMQVNTGKKRDERI
jgi:type IVB pilus formation R64 PilN family outer membrane protein